MERASAEPPALPAEAKTVARAETVTETETGGTEPETEPETETETESEADAVAEDIEVHTACEELFDPKLLSLDTSRIFDEKFKGRVVRWSGALTNVESYPFDFVFGNEPGTKAVVELYEMEAQLYGKKKIIAVVQLPPEAYDVLKPLVDQTVCFQGRLHSVDGFVNNVYVTHAQLQGELSLCRDAREKGNRGAGLFFY